MSKIDMSVNRRIKYLKYGKTKSTQRGKFAILAEKENRQKNSWS